MKWRLFAVVPLVLMLPACAPKPTQPVSLTFNHLALSVKDVDRSADFYGRVLKLREMPQDWRPKTIRWFSLGEGKELHLIARDAGREEAVITNRAVHLALTSERFDDVLKLLDEGGVAYGDWAGTPKKVNIRGDGVRQVYLQDPDGYWIEINNVGEK